MKNISIFILSLLFVLACTYLYRDWYTDIHEKQGMNYFNLCMICLIAFITIKGSIFLIISPPSIRLVSILFTAEENDKYGVSASAIHNGNSIVPLHKKFWQLKHGKTITIK